MGFLRALSAPAIAAAILVSTQPASAGSAAGAVPYRELRAAYPQVDEAVAALPDSGLHGTLNRITALHGRMPVRDLPPGSSEELPAYFERNMVRALEQLGRDVDEIVASVDGVDDRHLFNLLQVITEVAFEPNLELYSDVPYCPSPAAGCANPPVIEALDDLTHRLIPIIVHLVFAYDEVSAGDPALPAPPGILDDDQYNSQNLGDQTEALRDTFGWIHGEPIIDS